MKKLEKSLVGCVLVILMTITNVTAGTGNEQAVAVLKRISYQKTEKILEVSVELEGEFSYQSFELKEPLRLVVDFFTINELKTEPSYQIDWLSVKSIRTAQFLPNIGRVVFDLADKIPFYRINKVASGIQIVFWQEEDTGKKPVREEVKKEDKVVLEPKKQALEVPVQEAAAQEERLNAMVGFSLGSYFVVDERVKEIYGTSGAIMSLALSRTLLTQGRLSLDTSLEGRYLTMAGAATVTQDKARIHIFPVSLALRGLFRIEGFTLFLGVGFDFYPYSEKSEVQDTSGSTTGSHIQGGFFFPLPGIQGLHLKAYLKRTKAVTTENEIEVDLGGTEFGICLAYGFNFF